jgi:3-dehydroquinate synthase
MTHHRLSHGEAVAIGIAIDTRYCAEAGMLSESDADSIINLIEQLGLPLWDSALEREGPRGLEVLNGLEEFREHLGGELTVTLLDGIGRGREVHALDLALLRKSLGYLRTRALRTHRTHSSANP